METNPARKAALEIHGHKSEADLRYWCRMDEQDKVDRTERIIDTLLADSPTEHAQLVARVASLEGVLQAIADEAKNHHEYNPIGKVFRLPIGYRNILNMASDAPLSPVPQEGQMK